VRIVILFSRLSLGLTKWSFPLRISVQIFILISHIPHLSDLCLPKYEQQKSVRSIHKITPPSDRPYNIGLQKGTSYIQIDITNRDSSIYN
jgi:hypothetical protein